MKKIVIYTSATCPYCDRAKMLLQRKNAVYEEIRVDLDPQQKETMVTLSGRRTVPQIFIGDHHVGGCDDLYLLEQQGQLDALLS